MVDRLYGKGAAQSEQRIPGPGADPRQAPLGEDLDKGALLG